MSAAPQLASEFEELRDFIKKAEEETRQMKEVDLGDLDLKVSKLCDAAKSLPPEDMLLVQEPMLDMISALEDLADALKDADAQGNTGDA